MGLGSEDYGSEDYGEFSGSGMEGGMGSGYTSPTATTSTTMATGSWQDGYRIILRFPQEFLLVELE